MRLSRFLAVIGFCILTGCAAQKKFNKPFTIVQLSDPQLGFYPDSLQLEIQRYEKAVADVNKIKPAFVVITGDLVHHAQDTAELRMFKSITNGINSSIKVYLLPGNHDVGNTPSEADVAFYKKMYGYDRFSFNYKNIRFIGLNSSLIKAGTPGLEEEQYRWLEKQLASAKNATQILIFCHHPFFLKNPTEADDPYFNIPSVKRRMYMDLFKKYKVTGIFAGHYHGNAYGKDGAIQMITTSAVGQPLHQAPPGFTVIEINSKSFMQRYKPLE